MICLITAISNCVLKHAPHTPGDVNRELCKSFRQNTERIDQNIPPGTQGTDPIMQREMHYGSLHYCIVSRMKSSKFVKALLKRVICLKASAQLCGRVLDDLSWKSCILVDILCEGRCYLQLLDSRFVVAPDSITSVGLFMCNVWTGSAFVSMV